ncbi:nucleotidyltransferase family protein [bacterium]|nr:nucleotidyltransferase family protein [bacterium]
MISGIILAAGESRRVGKLKQLLPFGNSTIIETVIDNLLHAKLDEVIVILGHAMEKIKPAILNKPVKIVYNPDYKCGMLTSVQYGVLAANKMLASSASNQVRDGLLIALVDQPFLTQNLIKDLIEAFYHTDKGIVLPIYNGRRGHPVIFEIKYASEILALSEDSEGLREIVRKHQDDIYQVPVNTDSIIRDIDYWEDYIREKLTYSTHGHVVR